MKSNYNEEKKKVLLISEVFYPEIGSGSSRITNLLITLKELGYKVDIITSEPKYPNREMYKENDKYRDQTKEEKIYEGSNILRISGSKKERTSKFFNRLYIYLYFFFQALSKVIFNKNKYDIVIATMPSNFMGILGVIAKFKFKAKLIIDIRDLWPECIKNIGVFRKNKFALKMGYKMDNFVMKKPDAIVINSDGFREYLLNKGYEQPIHFIPNGLMKKELEDFEKIFNEKDKNKEFTVIYAGTIGLAQNVNSLVRVANHLRDVDGIKFKIIGDGIQKEKVRELIDHYSLKNVTLKDAMPKNEAMKEVAKSHIALVHLRGNSAFDLVIPGKIIDYMAFGIPIVAGVEGYTASIIKENKVGIVTEPDDVIALAKAIMKIYSNKTIADEFKLRALKCCNDKFLWDKNILKYKRVIDDLLEKEALQEKEISEEIKKKALKEKKN